MALKGLISWVNPTHDVDGNAYDAAANLVGYELQFDGSGIVAILPESGVMTTFDLNTLPAYKALGRGVHNIAIDAIDKTGVKSDFSAPATFSVGSASLAPNSLVVS